jgi:hypothetical protein
VGSEAGALSRLGAGSVSALGSSPDRLSYTTMPLQPGVGSSVAPASTHHGDTGVDAQDDTGEGGAGQHPPVLSAPHSTDLTPS